MMKKIIVLGLGMVGYPIVKDLVKQGCYEVGCMDISKENMNKISSIRKVKVYRKNATCRRELSSILKNYDIAVNALPGPIGFKVLQNVILAGKDVVDISFFEKDAFLLDKLAKKNKVTAIVDMGIAPGLSNVILGYMCTILDKVQSFKCYVGGLPIKRKYPFQYMAPFSPIDVIAEYTRPARVKENGKIVVKEALSEPEIIDFKGKIGKLEAFNTDGLRSLLRTMKHIPNMVEKTMRYPGHCEIMKLFKETGLFSEKKIKIGEKSIRPIDLTTKLLFPIWKMNPGDKDLLAMRIIVIGLKNKRSVTYKFNIVDFYDIKSRTTAMARTTGYTCTAGVNLVLREYFKKKGIIPPEYIGKSPKCYDFIIKYLKERGIKIRESIKNINAEDAEGTENN